MDNGVLIGKDVTVYSVIGGGYDGPNVGFQQGATYNMLGRWDSIEITFMNKPFEVTSSDAGLIERRFGPQDWKATLSGLVRFVGSAALSMFVTNQYAQVQFADGSGIPCTLIGGIESGSLTVNAEAEKDKLEIINMGFGGGFSFGN